MNRRIISVSKKTDIPAFFSEWFIDKIRKGYCSYPNTFNPNMVYRCSLKPEDVIVIVFWTKNPEPLMKYLPELDSMGYKYYFQYTVSPYGKFMEPNVPAIAERVETFKKLSNLIGAEKIIWRYDPIIISEKTSYEYHRERFSKLAEELCSYTKKVVISILDDYKLIHKRMKIDGVKNKVSQLVEDEEFKEFIRQLKKIAENKGLVIESCAEDLIKLGINKGSCVDGEIIQEICKIDKNNFEFRKPKGERTDCMCLDHIDIGMFNSCHHNCFYCYANNQNRLNECGKVESDTLCQVNTETRVDTKKKGILKKRKIKEVEHGNKLF